MANARGFALLSSRQSLGRRGAALGMPTRPALPQISRGERQSRVVWPLQRHIRAKHCPKPPLMTAWGQCTALGRPRKSWVLCSQAQYQLGCGGQYSVGRTQRSCVWFAGAGVKTMASQKTSPKEQEVFLGVKVRPSNAWASLLFLVAPFCCWRGIGSGRRQAMEGAQQDSANECMLPITGFLEFQPG